MLNLTMNAVNKSNTVVYRKKMPSLLCIAIVSLSALFLYYSFFYLMCREVWTEVRFTANKQFVIRYPESKLTIVVAIDEEGYPEDWNRFGTSIARDFIVSGYGRSGNQSHYGVDYWKSSYFFLTNKHEMQVFNHQIEIYRGRTIVVNGQGFPITRKFPLILLIDKDGNVGVASAYPVDIINDPEKLRYFLL